jgi:hypothetical protein
VALSLGGEELAVSWEALPPEHLLNLSIARFQELLGAQDAAVLESCGVAITVGLNCTTPPVPDLSTPSLQVVLAEAGCPPEPDSEFLTGLCREWMQGIKWVNYGLSVDMESHRFMHGTHCFELQSRNDLFKNVVMLVEFTQPQDIATEGLRELGQVLLRTMRRVSTQILNVLKRSHSLTLQSALDKKKEGVFDQALPEVAQYLCKIVQRSTDSQLQARAQGLLHASDMDDLAHKLEASLRVQALRKRVEPKKRTHKKIKL